MQDLHEMVKENIILEWTVGSHLYGTNTEHSDRDTLGVFVPSKDYLLGGVVADNVEIKTNPSSSGRRNTADDKDVTYWSIQKYFHLLSIASPAAIETLFAEPEVGKGRGILGNKDMFLSQRIRNTFGGYARSQLLKLTTKKDRLDAIRKARKAIEGHSMYMKPNGESLLVDDYAMTRWEVKGKDTVYHTFEEGTSAFYAINKLNEMETEYGLRTKSIEEHGYDTKFAMHLIRLCDEAVQLLTTGSIEFPLKNRDYYLSIRQGKYSVDEIIALAESQLVLIDTCPSTLPMTPDLDPIRRYQRYCIETHWDLAEALGGRSV